MSTYAASSLSIVDLAKAQVTTDGNPPAGTPNQYDLWIDQSQTPNVLYKYIGTHWAKQDINISSHSPVTVSNIFTTLGMVADDNVLDLKDRTQIKNSLAEIIGYVISSDSATLPSASDLDSWQKGSFYNIRKIAQTSGIDISDDVYTATENAWESLANYLTDMTPIHAWDTSDENKNTTITVDRTTFREMWLGYYQSVQDLGEYTYNVLKQASEKAQSTADDADSKADQANNKANDVAVQVQNAGGINLIKNSLGIALDADNNIISWQTTRTVSRTFSGDIEALNFEGGIYLEGSGAASFIDQVISCQSSTLSIGFYLSASPMDDSSSVSHIGVEIRDGQDASLPVLGFVGINEAGNHLPFKYYSGTFTVTSKQLLIRVVAWEGTKGTVTGLMANQGSIPYRWTNYPNESYTARTTTDATGFKVIGQTADTYTEMTPEHFGGYAPDSETGEETEVFELNGDVTRVHRLNTDKLIQLGSIRAVSFDNGTNQGWAFFPTDS